MVKMYQSGPLHKDRFKIAIKLEFLLKSGDLLFRASDAHGPLGIPFSRLVSYVTKCPYSHVAIGIRNKYNEVEILEINDEGTTIYRPIDWLDSCYTNKLKIMRLNSNLMTDEVKIQLNNEIDRLSSEDEDYDFTFSSPSKLYCTESAVELYRRCNILISPPRYLKEIVNLPIYCIIRFGGWFLSLFGKTVELPVDIPLWTPIDLLQSKHFYCIYENT